MKNTHNLKTLNDNPVVKMEIEYLTNKIYEGDATFLVYSLLKDTRDMKGLLEYLTGEVQDVCLPDTVSVADENGNSRPCFTEWITHCEQL